MKKFLIFLSFFVTTLAFSAQEMGNKIIQKEMQAEVLFFGVNFKLDLAKLPSDFKITQNRKNTLGGTFEARSAK